MTTNFSGKDDTIPDHPGDERMSGVRSPNVTALDLNRIHRTIAQMQRELSQLAAYVDSIIPGGDGSQHYRDHVEHHERNVNRNRRWSDIRKGAAFGLIVAVAVAAGTMLLNILRAVRL